MTVTREPEWDDFQRRRIQALKTYQRGICPNCGIHHSLAEADDFYWTYEERFCSTCASAAQFHRALAAKDEEKVAEFGEDPEPLIPRPDDGRTIVMRELTPAEVAQQAAGATSAAKGA